jgi:hypothetical protein
MPLDDNQGGELDLNNIVNDAISQGEGGESQTPQTFTQDRGQGELLNRTQQPPAGQTNQSGAQKLYAGKYKTPEEMEKAYNNINKMAGQGRSKLQQLEAMIQNPRFQQMAAQDPDIAQALAKAGYDLRREEAQEDARGQREWNGDENDPQFQMAYIDAKNELRWSFFNFGQERGKALSQPEEMAIREVLKASPRLSVKQAWKLTDHYEKELKAKEDERFAKLQQRNPNRPRPNPTNLPGQKLDLKKPVTEMNDAEKKAHLSNIIEQNS